MKLVMKKFQITLVFCLMIAWASAQVSFIPNSDFGENGRLLFSESVFDLFICTQWVDNDQYVLTRSSQDSAGHLFHHAFLYKLNEFGEQDESFGDSGKVQISFSLTTSFLPEHLIIRNDGKLLVIGNYYKIDSSAFQKSVVFQFLPNGKKDSGFGEDGKLTLEFTPGWNRLQNGKLIGNDLFVVGNCHDTDAFHSEYPVIAKINAQGVLDSLFAGDGKLLFDFATSAEKQLHQFGGNFTSVSLTDSVLYVGGAYFNLTHYQPVVLAFTWNGNLDTLLLNKGEYLLNMDYANHSIADMQMDDSGVLHFILHASNSWIEQDMVLGRFDPEGQDFIYRSIDFGENKETPYSIQCENNAFLIGGTAKNNGKNQACVTYVNNDEGDVNGITKGLIASEDSLSISCFSSSLRQGTLWLYGIAEKLDGSHSSIWMESYRTNVGVKKPESKKIWLQSWDSGQQKLVLSRPIQGVLSVFSLTGALLYQKKLTQTSLTIDKKLPSCIILRVQEQQNSYSKIVHTLH